MKIHESDHQRLKRVCMHEAGHLVLAKEMKFKTHGIILGLSSKGHDAMTGISLWNSDINSIGDLISFLNRRIKVLFAGVLTEFTEQDGKCDFRKVAHEWEDGGAIDNAKIRELLQTLRNISHPRTNDKKELKYELTLLEVTLREETSNCIVKRYSVIEAIANKLFLKVLEYNTRYEITDEEICQIPEVQAYLKEIE